MATELLRTRAEKFEALSVLLQEEPRRHLAAIEVLLKPCPGIDECPARGLAVIEAGRKASEWARAAEDGADLRLEHVRLYGSADMVTHMPSVAPCAAMYLGSSAEAVVDEVSETYRKAGFGLTEEDRSPTHASVELRFMSYLLRKAADGEIEALVLAREFITTHLYSWGIVFSAATFARSEHPVLRFAGLMLEHMLFCETEHARGFARSYAALAQHDQVAHA